MSTIKPSLTPFTSTTQCFELGKISIQTLMIYLDVKLHGDPYRDLIMKLLNDTAETLKKVESKDNDVVFEAGLTQYDK